MPGYSCFELDDRAKVKDISEALVTFEWNKIFDYISSDRVKVQEFNEFKSGTPTGAEEPFVIEVNQVTMFGLVHGRQEDCRIGVMIVINAGSVLSTDFGNVLTDGL